MIKNTVHQNHTYDPLHQRVYTRGVHRDVHQNLHRGIHQNIHHKLTTAHSYTLHLHKSAIAHFPMHISYMARGRCSPGSRVHAQRNPSARNKRSGAYVYIIYYIVCICSAERILPEISQHIIHSCQRESL